MSYKMRLGGHVSAAGGFKNALIRGRDLGMNAIQIFGSSPRQWKAALPDKKEAFEFIALAGELDIIVFLHAPYLINLASPDKDLRIKSRELLRKNLEISESIRAEGVILHLGSGQDSDPGVALEAVAEGVSLVLGSVPGESCLILENSAGGGAKIGATLSEIKKIINLAGGGSRLKVCLDTAHALEAGLVADYSPSSVSGLAGDIKKEIGWHALACLHLNDSKTKYNSHNDRHENIGKGEIGIDGFRNMSNVSEFKNKPWLLEVPGLSGEGPDAWNMDQIGKILS